MNIKDIEKHYDLLNHDGQTEIRTFSGHGQSHFVSGKKDFAETVARLNEKESVHCGVNQRTDFGKKNDDVRMINGFYFDIEGKNHSIESKCDSYILSLWLFNHLVKSGIRPVMADSGGGYHIFISLSVPIEVSKETKPKIERSMKRIKNYYKDIQTKESKVDITDVSLCKVERVIGTYNYRQKKQSKWLTVSAITDTIAFFRWIDTLPEPKKRKRKAKETLKTNPFGCMLMEYALSNRLPAGERNQVVCPNFMATCPSREQVKAFARVQDMNIGEIEGWKRCKTWEGKFNCPQMRKYAKRHGLSYLCGMCISNMKRNKGDIIFYETKGKQASYKQSQGRLILT